MYDLHRLGWHSFQQLCLTITREILGQTVQSFLDSNDAGRDGAFAGSWTPSPTKSLSGNFVIQCKFFGNSSHHLSRSDVAGELPKVARLAADGLCDVYVLMTNAGVSGRKEAAVRSALLGAGAKDVLVLGPNWIEDQIRESTRLRMLVPRLYGLGDLSQILDERAYAQARAVLESLREDLAKVVITDSYSKAVNALDEHSFVLLIGEPAAGKTTIASMLAMAAADRWKSSVLKLAHPANVVEHWNVDEPSQFFWIDDAFGVTQYESELAHGWNHSLPQVRAMLRKGAKIVMTSRDYIYNRARRDLKESAFPLLSESQVVIDVHDLSDLERQQILYNHLKLGKQPPEFRAAIEDYLEDLAAHARFIPETARRISDPLFTKGLYLSKYHLEEFVEKRERLLAEIIQGLDVHSMAALGMVYMRKDNLQSPVTLDGPESQALERLGSTLGGCIAALDALDGSLVTHSKANDQHAWRFKHPTIGDAYADTLALSPDMLGIFLSGSSTENLISQVTCGDVGIEKAVIVPSQLFPAMCERLLHFSSSGRYKGQWMSSWAAKRALNQFLASRCSKEFLAFYLDRDPNVLTRVTKPGRSLSVAAEVDLALRLHALGLLPEEARREFVKAVGGYAVDGSDTYALEGGRMRGIFTDGEFEDLVEAVRRELLPKLADVRMDVQSGYDSDRSPDEHMQDMLDSLGTLLKQFADDEDAIRIIERERLLANEWIAETDPPEPEATPRILGVVEPSEKKHGTRSIFDDIADDFTQREFPCT